MNQLRIAGCTPGALKQAGKDIIDRSLLWEVDKNNLWIKDKDKLVGIGGNIKQNKLTAGDNIEIIEEGENVIGGNGKDIIRLKDNIEVHSCTINPGTEEDPILPWKGSIFLGELTDGNQVYLITKATQVRDEDQALFGGQILVRMITKDKKEIFAQYAVTITSTGSWSLWGGNNFGANIRVCKAKYKGEWYYGLKIPSGDFQNVRIVDAPDIENKNLTHRTYLQMGSLNDPYKFYVGSANASNIPLIPEGPLTKDENEVNEGKYNLSIKDLVDNMGWTDTLTNPEVIDNQWKKWYKDDARLRFNIKTFPIDASAWTVHGESDVIYLVRGQDYYGGRYGTTRLNNCAEYILRVYADDNNYRSLTLSHDGQRHLNTNGDNYIDNENTQLSISYNHWYSCTVRDFQTLLGITFKGDWAKYASNTRYTINFRIYTKIRTNTQGVEESWTRLTCIQIRDVNDTSVQTDRLDGNYGKVLVDFTAEELDPPFKWTSVLTNVKGDGYAQTERYVDMRQSTTVQIGTFSDRSLNTNVAAVAENVMITSIEVVGGETDAKFATLFDQAYLTDNYESIINSASNHIPLFQNDWNSTFGRPKLFYANQEGIDGNQTYSFFADFINDYEEIIGHHYSEEYFIDHLDLDKTEFWYNGWYDLPEALIPPQPPTSELEFQVLAKESQDEDSFSEVFFSNEPISVVVNKIDGLQDLGEDAPPYKWVIGERVLSLADLTLLANHIKNSDKQIYLDLSNCTVADDAKVWEGIFEGCVSLRGLVIPQGVTQIGNGCFIWCTYMRELDLSPSTATLKEVGGGSSWATSMGLLTSTRIRTVITPKNVTHFSNYLVYSSNVENFITLYGAEFGPIVDKLLFDWGNTGWTSEWTWFGIKSGNAKIDELPEGFHLFFDIDFWNSPGFVRGRTTSGSVYLSTDRWTQKVKDSIVTYDMSWGQKEWQEFNNQYHWGEALINKVRRLKNPDISDLEIMDDSFMQ